MNVYVRELVSSLAQLGLDCTTYTRADRPGLPEVVQVEPGHRVVHVRAGRYDLAKDELASVLDEFTAGVRRHLDGEFPADVVHANYWLSGLVAHRLKHERDLPFVTTFHTLARVKAEGGDVEPELRERAEAEIIGCADAVCVNCDEEERQFRRLYGDPPGRVEVIAPAVEHAFFAPGDRGGARRALGLAVDEPVVLFVGRIQPLKGPDVAVEALAAMQRRDARLVVVGGSSGAEGERTSAEVRALVERHGLGERVTFVPPRPHHILSTYYRAADAVLVPSRSESFGLVALEASACGIPVVASAVGGLLTLVEHGASGFLVADRDPYAFARHLDAIVDDADLARRLGRRGHERSLAYTWRHAAARLDEVYGDLRVRQLVACG